MRADRLVALVLLLQVHGQMTAPDLADRLEVSERTVRRDLDALLMAGLPLYSQRGRGGGWALLDGHKINLSGLTPDEAQALFLVAGPRAPAGLGVEEEVRSALRKLLAALPAPTRERAIQATGAVHVDPATWGRDADQPPMLGPVREAVVAGKQIDLTYAKPGEQPALRRVNPYGLVAKGGVWYLLAGSEAGLRTYRVSRATGVTITDEPVERPEDFDLAQAWDEVRDRLSRRRGTLAVDFAVEPGSDRWVAVSLGWWAGLTKLEDDGEAPAGWQRYRAMFGNEATAASELARFGRHVRVTSPEAIRHELARLGRELLASNLPNAASGCAGPV